MFSAFSFRKIIILDLFLYANLFPTIQWENAQIQTKVLVLLFFRKRINFNNTIAALISLRNLFSTSSYEISLSCLIKIQPINKVK